MNHQSFLVARVVPHLATQPRYRCIAAIHNSFYFGTMVLGAVLRFLDLVKVPQNAYIVAEELKTLNGKYGPEFPEMHPVLCQYASLLLANAFCVDLDVLEDIHVSDTTHLPATMDFFRERNETSISIFDITDPLHPTYGLMSLNVITQHVTVWDPVSYGLVYEQIEEKLLSRTIERQGVDRSTRRVVNRLKEEPPIVLDVVREAWPKFKYMTFIDERPEPVSEESLWELPTLVELTLERAVHQALQNGSVMVLEHFARFFSTAMKECLRKARPFTFGAAHLMSLIVEGEAHSPASTVDLSSMPNCTTEHFLAMLPPTLQSIDALILSHNTHMDVDTLRSILEQIPKIGRLVLFDTGITNEDLASFLVSHPQLFIHVESLVHPLCLSDPSVDVNFGCRFVSPYPCQFTYTVISQDWRHSLYPSAFRLPTFTLPKIVQTLGDLLEPFVVRRTPRLSIVATENSIVKGILGSEYRKGERFGKRSIGMIPINQTPYDERLDQANGWVFAVCLHLQPVLFLGSTMPEFPCFGFFRPRRVAAQSQSENEGEDFNQRFTYEAHTLDSFLATCENEGRLPAVPEDVARLQEIFNHLIRGTIRGENAESEGISPWKEMTPEIFTSLR